MKEKKHLICIGDNAFKILQKIKYKGIVNGEHLTTWKIASDLILIGSENLNTKQQKKGCVTNG